MMEAAPGSTLVVVQTQVGFVALEKLFDQKAPIPHLESGDIIIDGGNSLFEDTNRRVKYCESKGLLYIGTGVSGGEEGARRGPSIMPGGSPRAWPHVKEIFQAVAAKVEGGAPCCDWVGEQGAGHYVKMVHNGIEYGDMQLIGGPSSTHRTLASPSRSWPKPFIPAVSRR
jgi:6-phosphogluconate dehydrogenase